MYGRYAIYEGVEYKASRKKDKITLYSKNEDDLRKGFKYNATHTSLVMVVGVSDVSKYYSKTLVCDYRGNTYYVMKEKDDTYTLYSPEKEYSLSELGFIQVSKGEYHLDIKKSEARNVRYVEEAL